VIESVKERALSRRDLFRGTAALAATAAATAVATAPAPLFAQAPRTMEDLTYAFDADFPTYFGTPGVKFTQQFNYAEHKFNLFTMDLNEHTGTHIDAPFHFSADGQSVDAIPVANLAGPLCIVDIRAKADANPDAQVTPDDLKAWIAANGPIGPGSIVAMLSGWGAHVGSPKFRNPDAENKMHFPGFHVEAAQMLIAETGAVAIGVDTLSLDHGPSADFATHYAWLPTNRYGIENLANLEKLPAKGATIMVGAPKHRGGSGGPARVVAMV
jgi:kynurenine formamidase